MLSTVAIGRGTHAAARQLGDFGRDADHGGNRPGPAIPGIASGKKATLAADDTGRQGVGRTEEHAVADQPDGDATGNAQRPVGNPEGFQHGDAGEEKGRHKTSA